MTYSTLAHYLLAFCVLLLVVLAALWRVALQRIGELRRALDGAEAAANEARAAVDSLAEMARTEERKAREFFGIIEGVERERDTWQKFYRESSHAAGVAQAWLMRDLARTIGQANVYAARLRALAQQAPAVNLDPNLQDVLEEFSVTHAAAPPDAPPAPVLGSAVSPS
jgi:cell division septum initiation protein DivIVA